MPEPSKLLLAVSGCDVELSRELIQAGADVNEGGLRGSPLHFAAANGDLELCRLLIDAGALLTIRDSDDYPALTCAARQGQAAACQLLVDAGADPYGASENDQSAFSLAGSFNRETVCDVLRALLSGPAPDDSSRPRAIKAMSDALHLSAMRGNLPACEILVGAGADVNSADHRGWTPLLLAAANNSPDICALLIAAGADPSLAGNCGRGAPLTPFQIAVDSGATKSASYFLESHGEDCAQRTVRGRTMSQLAGKHSQMKTMLKSARTVQAISVAAGDAPIAHSSKKHSATPSL